MIGPENLSYRESMLREWSAAAGRIQDSGQAQLDTTRGVEGRVPQDDAVDLLADLSDEVDLLIVGTPRQGPVRRWIKNAGCTARRLAGRTRCPLLILPSNSRAATVAPAGPSRDLRALPGRGT